MRPRTIILGVCLFSLFMASQVLLASNFEAPQGDLQQQITPTVDPFPRPTRYEILVAEQVFEHGRMFYLDPARRIWVLFDGEDKNAGDWQVFVDTWDEGEPAFDSSINAPDGMHQPIRGFGEVWRENEEVRERLGWALDPEIGFYTEYNFYAGELRVEDDTIIVEPGYHTLESNYGRLFIFDEGAWTWEVYQSGSSTLELEIEAEATEEAD